MKCSELDSPHFIHQAVHLTHQPLVLLLKLDGNTQQWHIFIAGVCHVAMTWFKHDSDAMNVCLSLVHLESSLNIAVHERNPTVVRMCCITRGWLGLTIWISSGESSSSTRLSSHRLTGLSRTSDILFSAGRNSENNMSFITYSVIHFDLNLKSLWRGKHNTEWLFRGIYLDGYI